MPGHSLDPRLEQAFRSAKIPYRIVGGVSFYERQEIKDVLSYLNLMANPKNDVAFGRVVNVPPRGIGKTTLDKLKERAEALGLPLLAMSREASAVPGLKDRAARSLRDFGMLMDELVALRDHSAEEVIRRLLTLSGYREALAADGPAGEDRLANIDELISAAREFDREHAGGTVIDFLEEISLASAVDRWNDDGGSVTLMTLHAAKGLEFPVAFIVGLEQGCSRIRGRTRATTSWKRSAGSSSSGSPGPSVSCTSAIAGSGNFEGKGKRPSSFLAELPDEALTIRDLTGGETPLSYASPSYSPRPRTEWAKTAAEALRIPPDDRLRPARRSLEDPGPPSADALGAFLPGTSVMHPQYGLGRIISINGAGPNRKGTVAFTLGGERTFILAKSPLKAGQGAVIWLAAKTFPRSISGISCEDTVDPGKWWEYCVSDLDQLGHDTPAKLLKAASSRYDEANYLAEGGRYLAAIYLAGYAAEMTIGAAYFRIVRGYGPRRKIEQDALQTILRASRLLSKLEDKSHPIDGLAHLLIKDKAALNPPRIDEVTASSLLERVQIISSNWGPRLRYRPIEATSNESDRLLGAVRWIIEHCPNR